MKKLILILLALFSIFTFLPEKVSADSDISPASVVLTPVADVKTELLSQFSSNYLAVASDWKEIPLESNDKALSEATVDANQRLIIPANSNVLNNKTEISLTSLQYNKESSVYYSKSDAKVISTITAKYRDFVIGRGEDLYELETPPQLYAPKDGHIKGIDNIELLITGKATGVISVDGKEFTGEKFDVNPATDLPWTWEDIDTLQAGVISDFEPIYEFSVRVNFKVGSQTFYYINPTLLPNGAADSWGDFDVSGTIPVGSTGAIIRIQATAGEKAIGWRKNGSADARISTQYSAAGFDSQVWTIVGVDASRIFEIYNGSNSFNVYLVGYVVSGVTCLTNATSVAIGVVNTFTDTDVSASAPAALGVVLEVVDTGGTAGIWDVRKNGSTDYRFTNGLLGGTYKHSAMMTGVDGAQVFEQYIADTGIDMYMTGYITDGATFYTNSVNLSIAHNGNVWTDLTAFPADTNFGFINVISNNWPWKFGLREKGSSDNKTGMCGDTHTLGIVATDNVSYKMQGYQASNTGPDDTVDFYAIGYAYAPSTATPVIEVVNTTNVTNEAADIQADLQSLSGGTVIEIGVAWDLAPQGNPGAGVPPASYASNITLNDAGFAVGYYTIPITLDSANTTWWGRSYAKNGDGYNWSDNETSFRTSPPPNVLTNNITDQDVESVSMNGRLVDSYNVTATQWGFVYDADSGFPYTNTVSFNGTFSPAEYAYSLAWSINTTGWYRFFVESIAGRQYGAEVEFTTLDGALATVTTLSATSVTTTNATFNANILTTGSVNITVEGFMYGTASGIYTASVNNTGVFGVGTYNITVGSLASGTTYYVQSFVTNAIGTNYGAEVTFDTISAGGGGTSNATTDASVAHIEEEVVNTATNILFGILLISSIIMLIIAAFMKGKNIIVTLIGMMLWLTTFAWFVTQQGFGETWKIVTNVLLIVGVFAVGLIYIGKTIKMKTVNEMSYDEYREYSRRQRR